MRVLGLSGGGDLPDRMALKSAFHRCAKESHPDLHAAGPGRDEAEARFKVVHEAYTYLDGIVG